MARTIDVIYEDGVFKPLNRIRLEEGTKGKVVISAETAVNAAFGLLKGKDTQKALQELEDEWGLC
ncbi:MAG: antitoxin family protein [Methanomicrobiales archaeon]|nr:antitoxin family protein [Methanomicrobiales archaeon]MDI6877301.1 antitoxin family protein [Methanomicrobiales archaeon]